MLSFGRQGYAFEEWELNELLGRAHEKYLRRDYPAAIQDFRTVLGNTKSFRAAVNAAGGILRIWKKSKEEPGTVPTAIDDSTMEQSLESLSRFDESKKPFGVSGKTEGEDAQTFRAVSLAQFYELKNLTQAAVTQRKVVKRINEQLVKAEGRMPDKPTKVRFYSWYLYSCLYLAEAHLANSDRESCVGELANLAKFYENTFQKEIQPADHRDHVQELALRVEVPVRVAKCCRRVNMEDEARLFAGKARSALNDFKQRHPTVPERTVAIIKEIEKGLAE